MLEAATWRNTLGRKFLPGETVHDCHGLDRNEIADLLLFASHADHKDIEGARRGRDV
jgi:hypothetical protein